RGQRGWSGAEAGAFGGRSGHTEGPLTLSGFRIHGDDGAEYLVGCVAAAGALASEALAVVEFRRVFAFAVNTGAVLPGGDIKQARDRTERGVVPIRSALVAGIHQGPLRCGQDSGSSRRPALFIETGQPVGLDERRTRQELTVGTVEHVENPIAVRPHHDFA